MPRRDPRAPSAAGSSRLARAGRSFQDQGAFRAQGAREVVEALQAEAFEELPCRPVQNGATGGLFATPFFDEAPRGERVEGLVAVDAADRLDFGSRHRLAVGDHRQRLQRGRREPEPVGAEVGRDLRRVLRGRHDREADRGRVAEERSEAHTLLRRNERFDLGGALLHRVALAWRDELLLTLACGERENARPRRRERIDLAAPRRKLDRAALAMEAALAGTKPRTQDRKSTRLNSSHLVNSY